VRSLAPINKEKPGAGATPAGLQLVSNKDKGSADGFSLSGSI